VRCTDGFATSHGHSLLWLDYGQRIEAAANRTIKLGERHERNEEAREEKHCNESDDGGDAASIGQRVEDHATRARIKLRAAELKRDGLWLGSGIGRIDQNPQAAGGVSQWTNAKHHQGEFETDSGLIVNSIIFTKTRGSSLRPAAMISATSSAKLRHGNRLG